MRFLLFILVFFFAAPSFAQQATSAEDKPLKNGRYRSRTDDYYTTGWVRHHKPAGKWIHRRKKVTDTGDRWVVVGITHYRHGQLHGRRTDFALNGDTLTDGNYRNGQTVGEWRYYQCEDGCERAGHLASVLHFDNDGNPIGTHYEYYSDGLMRLKKVYFAPDSFYQYTYGLSGELISRGGQTSLGAEGIQYYYFQSAEARAQGDTAYTGIAQCHRGVVHGFERTYERGHLVKEAHYEQNYLHGPLRLYKNDTLQTEWNFVRGERNGLHREYQHGVLRAEETYVDDERNGMRYIYASNGALQESGWYKDNVQHGEHVIYDTITKQKRDVQEYKTGMLLSHRKWTAGGQLIYEKQLSDTTRAYYTITEWHANGKLKMRGATLNSSYAGVYEEWHENGKRSVLMTYTDGYVQGAVNVWNEKGVLVYRATACQGFAGDDETVFDDNGRRLPSGSDACKAQAKKYAPPSLGSFVENGYRYADVVIAQEHVRDKQWPVIRHLYSETREEIQVVQSDPCNSDHRPQFPGGEAARRSYLLKNIRYPQMAREMGKEGTVFLEFTVNTDSTISDIRPLKQVLGAPGLTKEAMRVINTMPKWVPATRNGKPVAAKCVFGVKFVLQ